MSEIVNKFARCVAENLEVRSRHPASDVWPSPLADVTLVNDITSDYMLHTISRFFDSDNSIASISESFYRPSRLVYLMYLFAVVPKDKEDMEWRLSLAEKMLECISYLRSDDPFMQSGVNKIVNYENYASNIQLTFIDQEGQMMLRRILVALAVIDEYLYYAWVGLGRENHGPYVINGQRILVTDYFDLKPPFWPIFPDKLKYSSYTVYTDVEDSFVPKFDFNGRMHFEGRRNFSKACFLVDGEVCPNDAPSLKAVYSNLCETISIVKSYVKPLSGNELLLYFAKAQNYIIKQSSDKLGVDFPSHLPDEIIRDVLSASWRSTNSFMLERLDSAPDRESRIRVLQDYLMPGCN